MDEPIFSGYGIEIVKREGRYFLSDDAGEIACVMKEAEVSEEEAHEAQQSADSACRVILKCQNRANAG